MRAYCKKIAAFFWKWWCFTLGTALGVAISGIVTPIVAEYVRNVL